MLAAATITTACASFLLAPTQHASILAPTQHASKLLSPALRARPAAIARIEMRDSGLAGLSVGELKALLNERGVDYRDCLEKRDLIERLESSTFSPRASMQAPVGFTEGETRTVNVFGRVSPSVAFVQTTRRGLSLSSGFSLRAMEVPAGTGSGFVWDEDGHIITNWHVIAGGLSEGGSYQVSLQGLDKPVDARLVGVEEDKDIAVLKIDPTALPSPIRPLEVGTSSELQVGQSVMAIGNPFGLDYYADDGRRLG